MIDLVNDIRDKFNIADEEEIRFFQVENHKFKGELDYNKIATDEIPIYVEVNNMSILIYPAHILSFSPTGYP